MFRVPTAFTPCFTHRTLHASVIILLAATVAVTFAPGLSAAQTQAGGPGSTSQDDPALRFRVPTVTVTAQKEPEDKQRIPVSVTAVSTDTIVDAGVHIVSEAAIFAPNTFFTEWSA